MNKLIPIFLFLVLIEVSFICAAEKVYEFDLTFVKNPFTDATERIDVNGFRVVSDFPSGALVTDLQNPNVYSFSLVDKSGVILDTKYKIVSYLLSVGEDFAFAENVPVIINLPYFAEAESLVISNQDGVLLEYFLPSVCNNNRVCESGENYYSCEADCKTYSKDGVCTRIGEGECDPDCLPQYDPDCGEGAGGFVWKNSYLYWIVPGVLIILVILYFVLRKSNNQSKY